MRCTWIASQPLQCFYSVYHVAQWRTFPNTPTITRVIDVGRWSTFSWQEFWETAWYYFRLAVPCTCVSTKEHILFCVVGSIKDTKRVLLFGSMTNKSVHNNEGKKIYFSWQCTPCIPVGFIGFWEIFTKCIDTKNVMWCNHQNLLTIWIWEYINLNHLCQNV